MSNKTCQVSTLNASDLVTGTEVYLSNPTKNSTNYDEKVGFSDVYFRFLK